LIVGLLEEEERRIEKLYNSLIRGPENKRVVMKKLITPEQVQDQKKGHYKSFIVPNQAG
jgi:hypothetical protein